MKNNDSNKDEQDVTSLKDLNISDKKQVSNVLHGRKASTYLRIFRDDDGITDKEEDKLKLGSSVPSKPPIRPAQIPPLKSSFSNPSVPKRRTSVSLYDTHYKSCTVPRRKFSRSKETVNIENESNTELKPISSATYFPHNSEDQFHFPVELGDVSNNSDVIESDDDYYDDEDEQEHQDYPLAVELQPFTNNVGGHTAIFRFSKRAVCKALVNRENQWYENIELRHKELLQFMPRYIGVLNVRRHIYNKDFPPNETNSMKESNNNSLPNQNITGCPLKHVHSFPYDNSSHSNALPEVVLDDNRHMISDSLFGVKPLAHSPSSLPTDSYIHGDGSAPSSSSFAHSFNLGATTVNTKLKALVLQEVFAPTTNSHSNQRRLMRKSRASSHDNSRRNSNQSLKIISSQPITSPLLKKSLKESISQALNSPNSLMDLRQFHKKEMAREYIEDEEQMDTTENIINDDKKRLSARSLPGLDGNESISPLSLPLDRKATNDERIFEMDDDDLLKTKLPAPAIETDNEKADNRSNNNNESTTFEEQSDTVVSKFILLEDLTRKLNRPCALDLKMGTRQYGVDAKLTKQLSQREKCLKTTSRKLGVRICGLKIWNKSYYIVRDKYFGRRVKIGWQFTRVLARFIYNGSEISSIIKQIPRLVRQLDTLSNEISKLKGYRLYGSSLLLMYDGENPGNKRCKVKVNLIDFARCVTKESMDTNIESFSIPPKNPQIEDRGFLRGIRSLKFYLMSIWNYLTNDNPLCNDEEELNQLLNENASKFSKNWDWLDEFDNETEEEFNNPNSDLRTKWRKFELIFDLEPRYSNDGDVSD